MKRKITTRMTALLCAASLMLGSVSMVSVGLAEAKTKKPKLSKKKISLIVGASYKLSVKNAKGYKLTAKVKSKKIASIRKKGKNAVKVTAKKVGSTKAIITLKKGKKKYVLSCKVTVKKKVVPTANPIVTPIGYTATQLPISSVVPLVTPTQAVIATVNPTTGGENTPTEIPTEKPAETNTVEPTILLPSSVPEPTSTVESTIQPAPTASPTAAATLEPTITPAVPTLPQVTPTSSAAPTAPIATTPTTTATVTMSPASNTPVVTPDVTETVSTTSPAGTPTPTATVSASDQRLTFSADTLLGQGATSGNPVYNGDGSVTVTLTSNSGGGGIVFYIDSSKAAVDMKDYTKVVFNAQTDVAIPIVLTAYTGTEYWGQGASTALSYTNSTTDAKDYSADVSALSSVYGFGMKYNTYGTAEENLQKTVQLTIHSITLIKDTRDVTDATTNYSSLSSLAANYGFKLGTVYNTNRVSDSKYTELMKYHFNSLTAANEMKAYSLLSQSSSKSGYVDETSMPQVNFTNADKIMDYAVAYGIEVRGHTLVWDADMCDWFFRVGYDSNNAYASQEVVRARMKSYIQTVLSHFNEKYPGVIYCWDVVNEAVGDSSGDYAEGDARHVRKIRGENTNLFYDHAGEDYVELSFQYAREVLDSLGDTTTKLYYNDYSTFYTEKRDAICELVKSINQYKSDGSDGYVKLCDGVGMQSYIGGYGSQNGCMNESDITRVKTAIQKFAALDVEVQVTELAVRNYTKSDEVFAEHAEFYKKLFQAYIDVNAGTNKPLKAVSIWGIVDNPDLTSDDYSYRMNGPYCGLFDETFAVKPAFDSVYNLLHG